MEGPELDSEEEDRAFELLEEAESDLQSKTDAAAEAGCVINTLSQTQGASGRAARLRAAA